MKTKTSIGAFAGSYRDTVAAGTNGTPGFRLSADTFDGSTTTTSITIRESEHVASLSVVNSLKAAAPKLGTVQCFAGAASRTSPFLGELLLTFSASRPVRGQLDCEWVELRNLNGSSAAEVDVGNDGSIELAQGSQSARVPISFGPGSIDVLVRYRSQTSSSGFNDGVIDSVVNLTLRPQDHCQITDYGTSCAPADVGIAALPNFIGGVDLKCLVPTSHQALAILGLQRTNSRAPIPPGCTLWSALDVVLPVPVRGGPISATGSIRLPIHLPGVRPITVHAQLAAFDPTGGSLLLTEGRTIRCQ